MPIERPHPAHETHIRAASSIARAAAGIARVVVESPDSGKFRTGLVREEHRRVVSYRMAAKPFAEPTTAAAAAAERGCCALPQVTDGVFILVRRDDVFYSVSTDGRIFSRK